MAKYPDVTDGQHEAVINKLGGMPGLRRFLADELTVVEKQPTQIPTFTKFDVEGWLKSWQGFYNEAFSIWLQPTQLRLPPLAQVMGAGIAVVGGITIEQNLAFIKDRTPNKVLYRYVERNLDEYIDMKAEAARPDRPYAVWCAPVIEATDQAPELHNLSYAKIKKLEVLLPVANALEYWLLFAWHLWATGQALDRKTVTLTGSLDADGGVLGGHWRGGGACVDCYSQGYSHPDIRARQVVLPPLS